VRGLVALQYVPAPPLWAVLRVTRFARCGHTRTRSGRDICAAASVAGIVHRLDNAPGPAWPPATIDAPSRKIYASQGVAGCAYEMASGMGSAPTHPPWRSTICRTLARPRRCREIPGSVQPLEWLEWLVAVGRVEAGPIVADETAQTSVPGRICAELDRGSVLAGSELPGVFQQVRASRIPDQHLHRLADKLIPPVAEQPFRLRIDQRNSAVGPDAHHRVRDRLQQPAEPGISPLPLGHIPGHGRTPMTVPSRSAIPRRRWCRPGGEQSEITTLCSVGVTKS
jgi:hypothetical protein